MASQGQQQQKPSQGSIRLLIKQAKRGKGEAPYYPKSFGISDIRDAGLVQTEEKTKLDRVQLLEDRNEMVRLFGMDQIGSYFDLNITIVSLYPNFPKKESRWRLANVNFNYWNESTKTRYKYSHEQLIDYEDKRATVNDGSGGHNEARNVYKIGSLSLELVAPFAFSRIQFNGLMNRTRQVEQSADTKDQHEQEELVSIKLNISTHPTCDKFDYKFRFDKKHICQLVQSAAKSSNEAERLVDLFLEDRIDQPMMFQGHLEQLDSVELGTNNQAAQEEEFIMWGAKVKKFLNARQQLDGTRIQEIDGDLKDCLFVWAESGQQVHLTRSKRYPKLVHGMVHNSFDYASPLCDIKLLKIKQQQTLGSSGNNYEEISFDELESFDKIPAGYRITFRAFQKKDYKIEVAMFHQHQANPKSGSDRGLIRVLVNDFEAWALGASDNLAQSIRWAQAKLWILPIDDELLSFKLAEEQLLGGKGNSLIDLAKLTRGHLSHTSYSGKASCQPIAVSVPSGLVVSCVAYRLWLQSNPLILKAIKELDCTRRALVARLHCSNPLSDKFISMSQSRQILKEQCRKTSLVLNSCPLPSLLRKRLYSSLARQFGELNLAEEKEEEEHELGEKSSINVDQKSRLAFAIRSSAVGEDSLETSAAGQMRTILGARGFNSICCSIVECWSSQFEIEAVTYKTQNGLEFNLQMAVVIQQLINCKSAGVAATCDPLTGNKQQLEITANWGLGEGVVSGKQTDTVRVALDSLTWSAGCEDHLGRLTIEQVHRQLETKGKKIITKMPATDGKSTMSCCLSDEQILALTNLLLKLRQVSPIKDREVEWGITRSQTGSTSSPSSSSSSSSSSSEDNSEKPDAHFQIHLLQSRPLTNLQRLSTLEIRHELDYGICSPYDLLSRANLGEVMPGALCSMNSSFYQPITTSHATGKPFEKSHTRKIYVADSFAFYSGMATMVLSYSDTISRFAASSQEDQEIAKSAIYSMIGSYVLEPNDEKLSEIFEKMKREKVNPLTRVSRDKVFQIFAYDAGLLAVLLTKLERSLQTTILNDDLPPLEVLIEEFEQQSHRNDKDTLAGATTASSNNLKQTKSSAADLKQQIVKLYERIITRTEPLSKSWMCHIRATLMSMAFNVMSLKLLSNQPSYSDDLISTETLNDFSILMRGRESRKSKLGKQTESGEVSRLLDGLLESFHDEGLVERVRGMNQKELYEFLVDEKSTANCSRLYRNFMKKNGHRAFKEFCLSTKTWSDDPSYIIRLLTTRLKQFSGLEQLEAEKKRLDELDKDQEEKLAAIERRLVRNKALLTKFVLPRARNATIRRERTKSLLIFGTHKFRLALRHLGGLLCLAGRLPEPDLIFHLTIEELDSMIVNLNSSEQSRADLPRLIYKARRRQQQARVLDSVRFPHPTLSFLEVIAAIRQQTRGSPPGATLMPTRATVAPSANGPQSMENVDSKERRAHVRGLTSCGGCVTGRACIVSSLDEMDQLEPGDILITYSIDISWTVFFYALAGIVTEVGGIVSHGAVVAREYGLPTLCTAVGACSNFKTGQLVTLNADQGICYLAEDEENSKVAKQDSIGEHPTTSAAGQDQANHKN